MRINKLSLLDTRAELAKRSLHRFLRYIAWPALWPATPFQDNWHLGAICEHLEAVANGQIRRLVINMPFRMLKSTIVSQAFPAWDWASTPSRQYLTASYSSDLATRDAVDARRIIESAGYQTAYGDRFKLTTDQNVKSRYENDKRGARTITSTDSQGTGFGGDIRIVDDPVSAKKADSAVAIAGSIEWWKGTMATRANDPATGAAIIVHQRLNARDLSGYVLAEETGWQHLLLPMRWNEALRRTTSIGYTDPRTTTGELLHPARMPESVVAELEKGLGKYHTDAQMQQAPESRGGVIFKRSDWKFYRALPELDEVAISVDCTFKDLETSDYVAIQAWGRKGANHYLLRRVKEHLNYAATVVAVRAMAAMFPQAIAVLIEDKANGSAVIDSISGEVGGVLAINPEGGKVPRAYSMQPEHEAGNIYLPDPSLAPDIETFLAEASAFPAGQHDDEVDAMTQYVNWARKRTRMGGLYEWMGQQIEKRKAAA